MPTSSVDACQPSVTDVCVFALTLRPPGREGGVASAVAEAPFDGGPTLPASSYARTAYVCVPGEGASVYDVPGVVATSAPSRTIRYPATPTSSAAAAHESA